MVLKRLWPANCLQFAEGCQSAEVGRQQCQAAAHRYIQLLQLAQVRQVGWQMSEYPAEAEVQAGQTGETAEVK